MKKNFQVFLSVLLLTGALASCKNEPKLLTEAELTKKVDEMTTLKTKALEASLDQECSANMEALTNAVVDSILTAKRTEAAAAMPVKKKK